MPTRGARITKQTRHRYIAFEISSDSPVDETKSALARAISNKLRERSISKGHLGVRFQVIEYGMARSRGILKKVPHSAIHEMKALISSLDEITGHHIETHILGTSGTLRVARRKYMKYGE